MVPINNLRPCRSSAAADFFTLDGPIALPTRTQG